MSVVKESAATIPALIQNESRRQRTFTPDGLKDTRYWDRRKRNNDAARRSREKRRNNDIVMDRKVQELTTEKEKLENELLALKKRLGMLPSRIMPTSQLMRTSYGKRMKLMPSNQPMCNGDISSEMNSNSDSGISCGNVNAVSVETPDFPVEQATLNKEEQGFFQQSVTPVVPSNYILLPADCSHTADQTSSASMYGNPPCSFPNLLTSQMNGCSTLAAAAALISNNEVFSSVINANKTYPQTILQPAGFSNSEDDYHSLMHLSNSNDLQLNQTVEQIKNAYYSPDNLTAVGDMNNHNTLEKQYISQTTTMEKVDGLDLTVKTEEISSFSEAKNSAILHRLPKKSFLHRNGFSHVQNINCSTTEDLEKKKRNIPTAANDWLKLDVSSKPTLVEKLREKMQGVSSHTNNIADLAAFVEGENEKLRLEMDVMKHELKMIKDHLREDSSREKSTTKVEKDD